MARFVALALLAGILAGGAYLWEYYSPQRVEPLSQKDTDGHPHAHLADERHEEIIEWSPEKTKAADIHVSIAQAGFIRSYIQAPGKVLIHPDRLAYLTPTVSGIVKEIRKNQGDEVSQGEVLAVLESKEMAEAKAAHLAALKRLALKKALLHSEEELREISPRQDYLQARAALEDSQIEVELTKQKLYALGLSDDEIAHIPDEKPQQMRLYEIRAPFAGRVTERNITLGELIGETTKVYTIANFDVVWVEISIPSSGLSHIQTGQEITLTDVQGAKETAAIDHFTPSIDEQTRAFTAIAIVDNRSGSWAPGKFLRIDIQKEAVEVPIAVSKEAIQNMQGEEYVFIVHGQNFLPRVVTTGRTDGTYVEVLSGLKTGEQYADRNTFLLKAEFQKSEAEHSH